MKNVLYIGNKLSHKGKTPTTIETLSSNLKNEGFHVVCVSSKSNKILRLLDMLFAIFKHSKSSDYALIDTYSTQNFYYAYFSSQLCRLLRLKYIPILHGGNLPNRLKSHPKKSKAIFKNAYYNIAPSEYTRQHFKDFSYTNVKVIPNTINSDFYTYNYKPIETVNMLWVRSFSKLYNPNLAIEVLALLKAKGYNASLCMVGPDNDGSLQEAKSYAKQCNVEVNFTGKRSKTEWTKIAETCNLFINTTNFDNMPVSVIEAMALGLPVVSTNVGGMPFLVSNAFDGLLVEPNSADALAEAILSLRNDAQQAELIAKNARKKALGYDWFTVKKEWKDILQ